MIRCGRGGLTLCTLLGFAATIGLAQADRPTLRAGAGAEKIKLDGQLSEPVWSEADSIPNLTEVEPVEGRRPRGSTVVKVLASPKWLAIGVVCRIPPGTSVVSFAKARDAELTSEDHIRIVIDPFRDGRSGYLFAVNPSGARFDALVTNQGEGANSDWDAIWDAAAFRTDSTWSVEMRIPVASLSFSQDSDEWSFNVQRRVQGELETDRWASPDQNAKFGQTTRAGRLVGLPRFDLGRGLTIRPAVTAGGGHPGPGTDLDATSDASVDIQQRLGANLAGTVTFNTDFAETEVDTRRTNLTRFPLFFPEKRTFFLEGSDGYEFGLGLRSDLVPFFSRRVGLVDGREVPIRVGGKLNGQLGGTRVGAIMTRTGGVSGVAPGSFVGAVRVRRNIGAESSIGAIATFGDPRGGRALLGGADATYRTSRFAGDKTFLVGVWLLGSDREGVSGDRWAFGAKVDYPNDLIDAAITWKRIGGGFDPALGFVPRRGVHLLNLGLDITPRPGRFGIRQAFFENTLSLATDLSGRWESYRWFTAPINFRLEGGDRVEANVVPQGEKLTSPFEVADGVSIAPGTYRFTRYRLEVESAARRSVNGQATWWFGGFYGGTLHQIELEGAWRPSSSFGLELDIERNIGDLPTGKFQTTLVGVRVKVGLSPRFEINSFVQYDDESESIGSNSRLRWTITPVAELFLVYNHNVRDRLDRWSFESNQLLAKLAYAFRR